MAIFLRSLRLLYKLITHDNYQRKHLWIDESKCDYMDQSGNDFVYSKIFLNSNCGLMIGKFGTIELESTACYFNRKYGLSKRIIKDYIKGKGNISPSLCLKFLCSNAGFFPKNLSYWNQFCELMYQDISYLDILCSYCDLEDYFSKELSNIPKVNLNGFLYPFLWENPWSYALKGKKVLVIHPFVESIARQYERRQLLFEDPRVLPEFKSLSFVKAVQSMQGGYKNYSFGSWFDALYSMEKQIDSIDYDIAIIGCGAYGFPLAAYVKQRGKIALHLAGSTQMLFGIYGKRWENDPKFKKYINSYWIHPSNDERPSDFNKTEGGCYW
jgi:hypothetical protein